MFMYRGSLLAKLAVALVKFAHCRKAATLSSNNHKMHKHMWISCCGCSVIILHVGYHWILLQITNLWCESVGFDATDLSPFMGARSGPRCWVPGLDVWEPNLVPQLGARSGPFLGCQIWPIFWVPDLEPHAEAFSWTQFLVHIWAHFWVPELGPGIRPY